MIITNSAGFKVLSAKPIRFIRVEGGSWMEYRGGKVSFKKLDEFILDKYIPISMQNKGIGPPAHSIDFGSLGIWDEINGWR